MQKIDCQTVLMIALSANRPELFQVFEELVLDRFSNGDLDRELLICIIEAMRSMMLEIDQLRRTAYAQRLLTERDTHVLRGLLRSAEISHLLFEMGTTKSLPEANGPQQLIACIKSQLDVE